MHIYSHRCSAITKQKLLVTIIKKHKNTIVLYSGLTLNSCHIARETVTLYWMLRKTLKAMCDLRCICGDSGVWGVQQHRSLPTWGFLNEGGHPSCCCQMEGVRWGLFWEQRPLRACLLCLTDSGMSWILHLFIRLSSYLVTWTRALMFMCSNTSWVLSTSNSSKNTGWTKEWLSEFKDELSIPNIFHNIVGLFYF